MKRLILFRFHTEPIICKDRLLMLKNLNPEIEIYGLYGGEESEFPMFEEYLRPYLKENFCIKDRTNIWKWKNLDLAISLWYKAIGKYLQFDMLHIIEWDLLLFDSLENLYNHIPQNGVGLTALQKTSEIDNAPIWLKDDFWKNEWLGLLSLVNSKYNYNKEPYISLGPGICLPKSFLEKFSLEDIPDLSNDELRLPLFAQILQYELYNTNFRDYNKLEQEEYFNCDKKEIERDVIKRKFKIDNIKAFHPYREPINEFVFLFKNISKLYDPIRFKRCDTKCSTYIYDSLNLMVNVVDKKVSKFLDDLKDLNYNQLIEKCKDFDLDEINNTLSEILFRKTPFFNYINSITKLPKDILRENLQPVYELKINPDSKCNLSCSYCFKDTNGVELQNGIDFYKLAIDKLIYEYGKNLKEQFITFRITSEPFMDINNMEILVDYVRGLEFKTNKKLIFHFVTNGTILNDRIIKTIKKARGQNGVVHLSLDGPMEIQNLNRKYLNGKGTYDKVIRNVKVLKKEGFKISVSSVITKHYPYPYRVLEHLFSLDIDEILIKPVRYGTSSSFDENNFDELISGYEEYFDNIRKWILMGNYDLLEKIKNDFGLVFVKTLLSEVPRLKRCSFGNSYKLSMDNLGDFYTCDSFMGNKQFIVGNISTGISENAFIKDVKNIRRSACNNCWARYICGGTCYWNSFITKGDVMAVHDLECKLHKYMLNKSFELVCELLDNEDEYSYFMEDMMNVNKT